MKLEFDEEIAGVLEIKLPGKDKSITWSVLPYSRAIAIKINSIDKLITEKDNDSEFVFDGIIMHIKALTNDIKNEKIFDGLSFRHLTSIRDALLKISMGNDKEKTEKKTR